MSRVTGQTKRCTLVGCEKPFYGLGLCKMHHQRQWKYGTTDLPPRVSRAVPMVERFWWNVDKSGDCWLWTAYRTPDGYGSVKSADGKTCVASRVSFELANGPIPEGLLVRHRCDNPPCVRPDHLELGTPKQNTADKIRRTFDQRGETNPSARLTWGQVEAIRRDRAAGFTYRELVAKYGTSQSNVAHIVKGETWQAQASG
jgi:hypothetical protein